MNDQITISESRLRNIIREILAEKKFQTPFRVGDEFDAQEAAAKESYEAAVANLAAWDDNEAKKQALIDKAKELGVTVDTAKKRLKGDPAYQFDVNLAAKKRKTLEDEVEKTEIAYSKYNFERRAKNLNSVSSKSNKPAYEKTLPVGKKVFMKISDIKPTVWYPWPAIVKQSKLSYGSAASGGSAGGVGLGPGEEWLAHIFGAEVQGASVPFDIVTPDGRSWEIKALEQSSATIRPCAEGRKAFAKPRKRLTQIMMQLKNFSVVARRAGFFNSSDLSQNDKVVINFVTTFIQDEFEMIVEKGEISKERFITLRGVLNAVSKLRSEHGQKDESSKDTKLDTKISLNDKEVTVDKPTFIDIAKQVEKATGDKTIMSEFEKFDILLSTLKDPAFDNPTQFINEWFDSVDVGHVFQHVDGLFVVNTRGFVMIPSSMMKKLIKFEKVSQGIPKFSLVIDHLLAIINETYLLTRVSDFVTFFFGAILMGVAVATDCDKIFQIASRSTSIGKFATKAALLPDARYSRILVPLTFTVCDLSIGINLICLFAQRFPAYLINDFSGKFFAASSGSEKMKNTSDDPDSLASPSSLYTLATGEPPYVTTTLFGSFGSSCSDQIFCMSEPKIVISPGRDRSLVET